MSKDIWFKDLPEFTQNNILDKYGASCAEELGLDKQPYMTVTEDGEGNIMAMGITA